MEQVAVPAWIAEDDLLLKNAIEAGASLESLAKGAVQFSRRYSLTEIHDRWHSLLYDPVVSAEASARMVNLELSKSSGGSKEGLGEGSSSKRKVKSIRKQYKAMRERVKRHCSQAFFDSFDFALKDEMSIEKSVIRDDDECLVGNMEDVKVRKYDTGVCLIGGSLHQGVTNHVNNLAGYGNYSGLGEVVMSKEDALWKKIEYASAMRVQLSVENENNSVEATAMLPHGLKGKCANDVLKASAARSGEDVGHLSDSLLNMTNEDELIFVDIDGKDATDKPCYDNIDSLLLSSPCEIQRNDASDIRKLRKLDTGTKVAMPSESWAAGLEVVANPSDGNHGDLRCSSDPGNDAQSSVAAQSPQPEHSEGLVICFFNTEDPDVPSNDRIDYSIVVPLPVTPESQPIIKEVGCFDSSMNNQRKKVPDRNLKKEGIPSHSFAASQIVGPGLVPNINSVCRPVGVVVNTENPGRNPVSAVSGQTNNININPSHSRFVPAAMMPALDGRPKQKEIDAPASAEVYAHPKAGKNKGLPKSEANPFSLDPEGGDDDDDDDDSDNDDDNDIPYFSDVETMILEMDLCPTDQDTNASREVLRYQHEETKRTIMRLEQCVRSSMQREMASRGALAVLYGRKLKQYIKNSQVILGRSTDEMQVDIDLGIEGPANKISRRQALIKLEANGSFIIINLGKCSIFLNGKEVATGQARGLSASCIIEIKDMSFIFEINDDSVRRFLENVDKR